MIDLLLYEKPRVKEWGNYLVFREEWNKYRERFYARCRARTESQKDEVAKQKLISLGRKVKRVDEEMERHDDLRKEVQDCPTDIDAVVARRRKDFTGFSSVTYPCFLRPTTAWRIVMQAHVMICSNCRILI